MPKTLYPRLAQIKCPIGLCAMVNRCQHPLECEDGIGYLLGQKKKEKSKNNNEQFSDVPFPLPPMKRVVCCGGKDAEGEPCPGCPNVIPF